jgi:hypothetical protein
MSLMGMKSLVNMVMNFHKGDKFPVQLNFPKRTSFHGVVIVLNYSINFDKP